MAHPEDLPVYLIDPKVIDALVHEGALVLDGFLRDQARSIRRHYFHTGQPGSVLRAVHSLNRRLDELETPPSLTRARLLAFEAEMWIARGATQDELRLSAALATRACSMSLAAATDTNEAVEVIDDAWLLRSVAVKAQGRSDEALDVISTAQTEAEIVLPQVALVATHRQGVLIHQELGEHLDLLVGLGALLSVRPVEYFRTLKRVFEFLLNNGYYRKAEDLLPELLNSYRRVEYRLTPISRVSFAKKMGQLLVYRGRTATGVKLLTATRRKASALGYLGQVRQIDVLLEHGSDRQSRALRTFVVPSG